MTLLYGCTQWLAEPICIYTRENVFKFRLVEIPSINRFTTISIDSSLIFCIQFLTSIHQIIACQVWCLDAHLTTICNPNFTWFRSFTFDYNNSICCSGTIDSSSSSIFQDNNRCNTIRVEVRKSLYGDFKSVHDKKRLIGISLIFSLYSLYIRRCRTQIHTGTTTHTHVRKAIWI